MSSLEDFAAALSPDHARVIRAAKAIGWTFEGAGADRSIEFAVPIPSSDDQFDVVFVVVTPAHIDLLNAMQEDNRKP